VEMMGKWMKHFVKGKFVTGDKLSIADFKAGPFLFCLMQPAIETKTGFKLSDRAKQYTEDFMAATSSSGFLKSAGVFAIAEFAAQKVPDAGPASRFTKQDVTSTFSVGKPDGKVKVYGMPPSANACGPILLAMEAGVGGFEMCNLMEGEHNKPDFVAMNPFSHIPTIKDGDFAIGESLACLRYLAIKYKPEYYPVKDAAACGKIDFACESFSGDVYPKIGPGVFYPVFGFSGPPEDQAKANTEASELLDKWMKHFVEGKFVNGDTLSIADFKAAPFLFALMQPVIESKTGFELSDAATGYVNRFMTTVKTSEFLKSAGGFSIVEYTASKA